MDAELTLTYSRTRSRCNKCSQPCSGTLYGCNACDYHVCSVTHQSPHAYLALMRAVTHTHRQLFRRDAIETWTRGFCAIDTGELAFRFTQRILATHIHNYKYMHTLTHAQFTCTDTSADTETCKHSYTCAKWTCAHIHTDRQTDRPKQQRQGCHTACTPSPQVQSSRASKDALGWL